MDELARAFMEMHHRHIVARLFLSSGIAGSGFMTTERLIQMVDLIRQKHGLKRYISMKVTPGTDHQNLETAYLPRTHLSVNVGTPTAEMVRKVWGSLYVGVGMGVDFPFCFVRPVARRDGVKGTLHVLHSPMWYNSPV